MESSTEQHRATARPARTIEWIVWGGVALTIAAIALAFVLSRREPAFTLTNQAGRAFSSADLRGRVWVADVIFTRCPGLCATLTRHMGMLQSALPTNGAIQL